MARDPKQLFEILINDQRDMLWGYLRSTVYDRHAAEDLFQEVILVAWRRLDDYDSDRPFGAWLRGIAGKLVLAYFRKKATRSAALVEEDTLNALALRFSQIEEGIGNDWNERLEALLACIENLNDEDRGIVRAHYFQALQCKDIADSHSLGIEAIKKRLQRARAALADCITRKSHREEVVHYGS
ncbi:MAG: sigma-70 family RNA polymerase sigma factor [Planctomycetes bacterium]|nr:sigma-70 family RNA polymerase sigma factor [Planctomycetota bacterium]